MLFSTPEGTEERLFLDRDAYESSAVFVKKNQKEYPILGSKGYAGQEHFTHYGVINMNARLYDPVVGHFLSPDPYIQDPDFSQNFNRYSSVLNNIYLHATSTSRKRLRV